MTNERGPAPDPRGPGGSSFTIAGHVSHWEPTARELTSGGRILRVADSVFFVGNIPVGASIMASGHQPPDPSDRWVVTRLRVG